MMLDLFPDEVHVRFTQNEKGEGWLMSLDRPRFGDQEDERLVTVTMPLGPTSAYAREQAERLIDLVIEMYRAARAANGCSVLNFPYTGCESVEQGLSDVNPENWHVAFTFFPPEDEDFALWQEEVSQYPEPEQ